MTTFSELVKAGVEGLAAGELARITGVAPNTLSARLKLLSNANLVTSRRAGTSIVYTANPACVNALIAYLAKGHCPDYSSVYDIGPARTAA